MTPNQPVALVWTSKASLLRDLEVKKNRALQELQALREKAQSAPPLPPAAVETAPEAAEPAPVPAAQHPAPSRKHGNTRHATVSNHVASPETDLRKCLDMPTDRDVARCAAH